MSSEGRALIAALRRVTAQGCGGVTLWPCEKGWQANVKHRGGDGWHVIVDADPIDALLEALQEAPRSRRAASDEDDVV